MSALDELIAKDSASNGSALDAIIARDGGSQPDAVIVQPTETDNSRSVGLQARDAIKAFNHHVLNIPHGVAQFIENGIDKGASYLPENPVSNYIHKVVQQDNAAMQQRERDYQNSVPDSAGAYTGAALGEVAPFAMNGMANGVKYIGDLASKGVSRLIPGKVIPQAIGGATQGAAVSTGSPVTEQGDYWNNKADQVVPGVAMGSVTPSIVNGVTKFLSPSNSAAYNTIANAGVNTTIGQRLGGVVNSLEEKAQSLPVVGDFISQARNRSLHSWNEATLNDVVAPVGAKVTKIGHEGVTEAGDILSAKYNQVLSGIKGVSFDNQFGQDFGKLKSMAQSLTPDMAARFNKIISNSFESRLSPANGMTAETLKSATSDISGLARKYSGSSVASEQELGAALSQVDSLINQQISRANPQLAPTLNAIDTGWAKLVRVEGAAKAAASNKVNTGVFTPGQLMSAVRSADQSVRDRATARGQALMQDWASAGVKVIGDKVPNSGTFDRASNGALIAALIANPSYVVPASAAAGAGGLLYSPFGQRAAVGAANKSQAIANALQRYVPAP